MAYSLQDAVDLMDETSVNFIIGGASIYRQFFPYTQFLYLTRVFTSPEADTFFPQLNEEEWELIEESPEYIDEVQHWADDFSRVEVDANHWAILSQPQRIAQYIADFAMKY